MCAILHGCVAMWREVDTKAGQEVDGLPVIQQPSASVAMLRMICNAVGLGSCNGTGTASNLFTPGLRSNTHPLLGTRNPSLPC